MRKCILLSIIPGIGFVGTSIGASEMLEQIHISTKIVFYIGMALIVVPPIIFFLLLKHKKVSDSPINKTSIKSLLDDTYSLYNETGLFIKNCYTADAKISWGKLKDLNKKFESYLKAFKGKVLGIPQELEPKMLRFHDILFDFKRRGESLVSTAKTHDCYKRQQKLEHDFSGEAPVLYSELEVELRKLINRPPNKAINSDA